MGNVKKSNDKKDRPVITKADRKKTMVRWVCAGLVLLMVVPMAINAITLL